MLSKKINNRWIIRIAKGEELVTTLLNFCEVNQIKLGSITGIGAVNNVKIGLFNTIKKQYIVKDFSGDMEITSLIGNISIKEGEVLLHLHINLANSEFMVFGGHLFEAYISATCEIILDEINGCIERKLDPESGLYLLNL
jgi:uncharacterized protein